MHVNFYSQFIYTHSGIFPACIWKAFRMNVPTKEIKRYKMREKKK